MTHHQSELARLQRYRDAMCESEFEFAEPEIELDSFSQRLVFLYGGVLASWLVVGLIAVLCLR